MLKINLILLLVLLSCSFNAHAKDELIQPFVLVETYDADYKLFSLKSVYNKYKKKIDDSPFKMVDINRIDLNHVVFIFSNNKLNKIVSKERFGGFAATMKLSISKVGNEIQVSYINPTYLSHAYQFKKTDLKNFKDMLTKHIGFNSYFGKEIATEELRKRLVMSKGKGTGKISFVDIKNGKSRNRVVRTIEKKLKETESYSLLYKINLKNKRQTVLGIKMKSKFDPLLNDAKLLSLFDSEISSASSIPIEIVVDGHSPIVIDPIIRHSMFLDITDEAMKNKLSKSYSVLFNNLTGNHKKEIVSNLYFENKDKY